MILKTKHDYFIFITSGILVINLFLSNIGLYGGRTSPPLLIGSMALLILSIHFINERKMITKISAKKFIPIIIMGLLFFIYGILFLVPTYILYAFIFMFQLLVFAATLDLDLLNRVIYFFSRWVLFIYTAVLLCCFLIAPLSSKQYSGILGNPNLWGECISLGIIIILYVYETINNDKCKIALLVLFGLSIAHMWFSRSRTTMLAVIAVIVVYVIYSYINKLNLKKRFLCFSAAIIILIPLTYGGLTTIAPTVSESIHLDFDRTYERFVDQVMETPERYLKGVNDEGSISSGRVEIWKRYISEISLIGHSPDPISIWNKNERMDAHNTFLQTAYQGGIPTLIAFTIPLIANLLFLGRKIIQKKVDSTTFFVMANLAYACVYMLLSSSFGPYNAFSMIGFWLFSIPSYLIDECEKVKLNSIKNSR